MANPVVSSFFTYSEPKYRKQWYCKNLGFSHFEHSRSHWAVSSPSHFFILSSSQLVGLCCLLPSGELTLSYHNLFWSLIFLISGSQNFDFRQNPSEYAFRKDKALEKMMMIPAVISHNNGLWISIPGVDYSNGSTPNFEEKLSLLSCS